MHHVLDRCSTKPHILFRYVLNSIQVEIETERLFIHSYQENDFEDCVCLYGNDVITKHFDHGKVRSRIEVKKLIQEKMDKYFTIGKPFGIFSIFHKETMSFIGQIDLLPSDELGTAEIGFILHEQYHNQGLCTEAVGAIIFDFVEELNNRNFECDELPIYKIIATVHPRNQASKKVLEKFGMILDKVQDRFGNPLWYSVSISLNR